MREQRLLSPYLAQQIQVNAMSTEKPSLLIVEDDTGLQSQLRWHFDDYNIIIANDRKSAIEASST